MNEDNLAKRAVACKHWRWMPGMRMHSNERYDYRVCGIIDACYADGNEFDGGIGLLTLRKGYEGRFPANDELPDLDDPATIGCLLALVRERHGMPHLGINTYNVGGSEMGWTVTGFSDFCTSEAEALVVALEGAS